MAALDAAVAAMEGQQTMNDCAECPECGSTNTVVWPLYGRFMAARCDDCGYEGDNLDDKENFGYRE